jgi:tRNA(Ile)-lysidine synthase TilS/MesJ
MMTSQFSAHNLEQTGIAIMGVSGGPDSLCMLDLAIQIPS